VETKKVPLLTPIMRWFLFAMVLANIAGQMSPMLMPIYLTELGASVGQVGIDFTISSIDYLSCRYLVVGCRTPSGDCAPSPSAALEEF
jgi:hypothetical protein